MFKKFYNTVEIYEFIDILQRKNSDFVKVLTIGYTKQGTPLKIVHIDSNNYHSKNDTIWLDGGTRTVALSSYIKKNIFGQLLTVVCPYLIFVSNISFLKISWCV